VANADAKAEASRAAEKLRATESAMTPPQVAKRWRVSSDKVLAFVKKGELKAFNVALSEHGRPRFRVLIDDVLDFEQRRTVKQKSKTRRQRNRRSDVIHFF
jgi:hypothetical protein